MKIKKHYLFVALALCTLSAFNYLRSQQENQKNSSLALANLQAIGQEISSGEDGFDTGKGNKVDCYCSFTDFGKGNLTVYDCGPCTHVVCAEASDQRTCRVQ